MLEATLGEWSLGATLQASVEHQQVKMRGPIYFVKAI